MKIAAWVVTITIFANSGSAAFAQMARDQMTLPMKVKLYYKHHEYGRNKFMGGAKGLLTFDNRSKQGGFAVEGEQIDAAGVDLVNRQSGNFFLGYSYEKTVQIGLPAEELLKLAIVANGTIFRTRYTEKLAEDLVTRCLLKEANCTILAGRGGIENAKKVNGQANVGIASSYFSQSPGLLGMLFFPLVLGLPIFTLNDKTSRSQVTRVQIIDNVSSEAARIDIKIQAP